MKLYFKDNGSLDTTRPNEAQVFAHSGNADTLYVFCPLYWDTQGVFAYADFKLPLKNSQGQWSGYYDAKSLQLAKATLDGVDCWKANIPSGYLANNGRAYVSISIHYGVAPNVVVKTTQAVPFEVQDSVGVIINPLLLEEADQLNARLTEVEDQTINLQNNKQDKEDSTLQTTSKNVVGAINEVNAKGNQTKSGLDLTNEALAQAQSDINYLKQHQAQVENYIGQMNVGVLPTDEELNTFVQEKQGRAPMNADVVIVVNQIAAQTDKVYKYTYTGTGWKGYEIPPLEAASNDNLGSIRGTYYVGNESPLLVNISGGQILNIYVKQTDGNGYRDIVEFAQTTSNNISDILTGALTVAKADEATKDALGNLIHATYLTQSAGATKQFVRDYALPKIFNEILFISASGFTPITPTTPTSGIQFTKTISTIGETNLFTITREVSTETEISKKNSINTTLHIRSSVECDVQVKITASIKHPSEEYIDAVIDIMDIVHFEAGEIKKITSNEFFLGLGENVFQTLAGDIAKFSVDIITTDSSAKTFNVYSNATYPSNISINVATQSIVISQGALGEQPIINVGGTYNEQANTMTFTISGAETFNNNTEAFLKMTMPKQGNDLTKIMFVQSEANITLITPYNQTGGVCLMQMLYQLPSHEEGNNIVMYTKVFIDTTTDIKFYMATDNILTLLKDTNISVGSEKLNVVINRIQNAIPTKTSQLTNDSNFATTSQIPTKTSELQNDSGYALEEDIPTKTSELENDSGFITNASIPTKTSQITNDSGFITNNVSTLTNYELKTNTGTTISMSMDTTNYKLTMALKNREGTTLSTQTIDFPIESMVVSARYDSTNKVIIMTLQSGSTISFSVADLVSGLVPDTRTINGKALSTNITLSKSDIGLGNVDNTSDLNKPVSTATQTALNAKQGTLPNTDGSDFKGIKVVNGVITYGDISGVENPLVLGAWEIYSNGTLLQFKYNGNVVFAISSTGYVNVY